VNVDGEHAKCVIDLNHVGMVIFIFKMDGPLIMPVLIHSSQLTNFLAGFTV
jgi:hypothetical protein